MTETAKRCLIFANLDWARHDHRGKRRIRLITTQFECVTSGS
jgi:hypothetical protein